MKKNKTAKAELWADHIRNFQDSDLSHKEWCQKQGIALSTFNYWFRKPDGFSVPCFKGGRGVYGWCSINEIWNASGEKYREINRCVEYLNRPIFELAATLLHEMAHLYNLVHDIQDVSNNSYYHNMTFKATAEAHGLHIEKHQKYGWTVTTLAPKAEIWIKEAIGEAGIHASRQQEQGTAKGGSKKSINRSIKYVCPCCGTIIRATREVNVICGDYGEPFEKE